MRLVFEKERRAGFRIGKDRIKKVVRFVVDGIHDRIDVIDTDDGTYVVDIVTTNAGIFTTAEVYSLGKGATLKQRLAVLERVPQLERERLRRAVTTAYGESVPRS